MDTVALPDFRNLGVIARVLVAVNALAFAAVLAAGPDLGGSLDRFVRVAVSLEPVLLANVVVLVLLSPLLRRLPYAWGALCVLALVLLCTGLVHAGLGAVQLDGVIPRGRAHVLLLAALMTGGLLGYFHLFARAHSPALAQARLQALQSRIRPHFLFNSLNAVLSLVRSDPRRAERALQDLADLFRTLMSDAGRLARLADEIVLLERYASIEQLRLGERLRITWALDAAPDDAAMPPLVLQPLLENAVYHGVEPATGPADILVEVELRGTRLRVRIENPHWPDHVPHAGNRMALENIRERLTLFFDAEAHIETRIERGRYCTLIEMPYRPVAPEKTA
ncbi:MAG TPA: histidine kinase [Burkholderiales bacterium]